MEDIEVKKLNKYMWEIPKTKGMNVPGLIFASEKLMEAIKKDKTLTQVRNVAMLPGIIKASIAMSDAHQGYGFSIGGVAAFDIEGGVISPGGVGYDINCGVRLLRTNLTREDVEGKKEVIIAALDRAVPSGVGKKGRIQLSDKELDEVMLKGSQWAVEAGYGNNDDWKHTEEEGKLEKANPKLVSQRARARGRPQLGSLGAGNHFIELQYVDEIFNENAAKTFGLEKNQVVIMIHCGSRGLGHQVASDYIKKMEKVYGTSKLPDRELVNAPIKSELGQEYYGAMCAAANFAFANRQLITHWVREEMIRLFPKISVDVVYDVCHNIAKYEKHNIDGMEKELLIMRKGATRSFGPERSEIPQKYRKVGQPVIIPGSMGTASYVLVGTREAEELSFGSCAHGAGRVASRTQARRELNAEDIKADLERQGIVLKAGSFKGIVEEAPQVYKDIEEVVKVSDEVGIGRAVARLKPLGVVKG